MSEVTEGYADALFGLASAESQLERVESELYSLARAVEGFCGVDRRLVRSTPALRTTANPDVGSAGRSGRPGDPGGGQLLIRPEPALGPGGNRRPGWPRRRRCRGVARWPRCGLPSPLSPDTVARLEDVLSKVVGHPVEARVVVDTEVLGGLVARVGDLVVDGTVPAPDEPGARPAGRSLNKE